MSSANAQLMAELAEIADLARHISSLAGADSADRACARREAELASKAARLAGLADALRARASAEPEHGAAFDHVGIAVRDLRDAAPLFIDLLGGRLVGGGTNDRAGLRTLILKYPGGGKIELLQSVGETPLSRFIARRGEGVHHMTFLVDDLRSEIIRFRDAGYTIVDEDYSEPGWFEAYVSPRSGHGCLIQLVQAADDYGEPVEGMTVPAVLNDAWEWIDQKCHRRSAAPAASSVGNAE